MKRAHPLRPAISWIARSRTMAELPADLAAAVITDMDTADALDMLRELPAEKKQTLAAHLDDDTRKDVRRLLAFHQEEIGSRMSGNFVCIPDTLTVCGAMNELVRQAGEHDNISTLYVVDGSGVFAGAIDVCNRIYNNNHLNPTDNAGETETDESDASAKEEAAAHV